LQVSLGHVVHLLHALPRSQTTPLGVMGTLRAQRHRAHIYEIPQFEHFITLGYHLLLWALHATDFSISFPFWYISKKHKLTFFAKIVNK